MATKARWAPWVLFSGLGAATSYLSIHRVYQVDEAQNAYTAWVMGAGLSDQFYVDAPLFLLPLAALSRYAVDAQAVFFQMRLGFLALFWLNLALMVWATGLSLRTPLGQGLMILFALLPPLWTYGLEARHENVILLGILVIWNLGRHPRPGRWWAYPLMGLVAAFLQLSAGKAMAYWIPLCGFMLVLPHPGHGLSRPRLWVGWATGALVGTLLAWALCESLGVWPKTIATLSQFARGVAKVARFSPWMTWLRLVKEAPLLVVLLIVGGVRWARLSGARRLGWEGPLPEVLLFCLAGALLFVNPTPFPYNLLSVVVSGALAAFALNRHRVAESWANEQYRWLAAGLCLVGLGLPLSLRMRTLITADNRRQLRLMELSQQMTDPTRDRVYDSAGLVPTRKTSGYYWFVNIISVAYFENGTFPSFESQLLAAPPSVILPTYRLWNLHGKDRRVLRDNFIALAADFWVLGARLGPEQRMWNCLHEGRYLVAFDPPADPGAWIRVDGHLVQPGPRHFDRGPHSVETSPHCYPMIAWIGPNLTVLPPLKAGAVAGVFPDPNAF